MPATAYILIFVSRRSGRIRYAGVYGERYPTCRLDEAPCEVLSITAETYQEAWDRASSLIKSQVGHMDWLLGFMPPGWDKDRRGEIVTGRST